MNVDTLDLQPQTLGERWFAYQVRFDKTKTWAALFLIFGIVLVTIPMMSVDRMEPPNVLFCFGLFSLITAVMHFERNGAYTLLKRQQEEIDRLEKAYSANEST